MEVAGRLGWAARGVLYLLVAILVVRLPMGRGHEKADQKGAFATLAESRFGGVLLGIVAAGLLAFAVWRAWSTVRGTDEKPGRRIAWAASALVYLQFGFLAVGVLRGRGSGGHQKALTARVLEWPGGPLIVGAIGAALVVIAGVALRKAVQERFRRDIDEHAVPTALVPIVRVIGVAGWVGRSMVGAIAGWFVLQAAWNHDPSEPIGLDESLRRIGAESWGPVLLVVASIGLASFAVLCLATAAWLDPPDS